jgi:hypothetical protein
VAKLEDLQTALAEARNTLGEAVAKAALTDWDRTDPNPELEALRSRCRQIRTSIIKLERAETASRLHDAPGAHDKYSADAFEERIAAIQRPKPHARRGSSAGPRVQSKQGARNRRFRIRLSTQDDGLTGRVDAKARQNSVRQVVSLIVLVLAYLQYYLIDINAQIAQLPAPLNITSTFHQLEQTPARSTSV